MYPSHSSQSKLPIGSHVLVNGIKSGTLHYVGHVQFAQGLFCGIELDESDGRHDGQVNDVRYDEQLAALPSLIDAVSLKVLSMPSKSWNFRAA